MIYSIVSQLKGNGDSAFDGGFPTGRSRGDLGDEIGACVSATCISFVTVGEFIVVLVIAVASPNPNSTPECRLLHRHHCPRGYIQKVPPA